MAKVEIYATAICPYCAMAKQLFDRKGVEYTEVRVDLDPAKRQEMIQKSRQRTVPQIFINNEAIGGYTDLVAIDREQKLDDLLV
ncbi:MAG: glutaredoxin 3 [Methylophaga sp.]|nr:MAG: glutaredoxin 3 [Methylophaga sp.]